MLKHPSHYVGDVWFYIENEIAHAFYLVCPESVPPHTRWDIGHATSRDLIQWELHPIVLSHGAAGAYDECLATGSVFRKEGRYGMTFTSHTLAETGLAWSDNLFDWTVDSVFPTTAVDLRYYEANGSGKRTFRHWRDPFILHHQDRWYQFVCASNPLAPLGARGTVGVSVWTGENWDAQPPLDVEPFCQEMECPQIVVREGVYYLLFSTMADFIADSYRKQSACANLPWGGTFVMTSENLLGPYCIAPSPLILPATLNPHPYACQLVSFKGHDYLLGTIWPEGGLSYISDPCPVRFTPTGIVAD